MNYYFVSNGYIVESGYYTSQDELEKAAQDLADELQALVYVIQGQHYGIEKSPGDPRDQMAPDEVDQAVEDTELFMTELDKLERWNAMARG